MADEQIHVTTTEARAGSRGRPVKWILITSLALIVILFAIVFAMGGIA